MGIDQDTAQAQAQADEQRERDLDQSGGVSDTRSAGSVSAGAVVSFGLGAEGKTLELTREVATTYKAYLRHIQVSR